MKLFQKITFYFILLILVSCNNLHKETIIPSESITQITDINLFSNANRNNNREIEAKEMDSYFGCKIAELQAKAWDNTPELVNVTNLTITFKGSYTIINDEPKPKMIYVSEWLYIYKNSKQNACLAVIVGNNGVVNAGFFYCSVDVLRVWTKISKWAIEPNRDIKEEYKQYSLLNINNKPVWLCPVPNLYQDDEYIIIDANSGKKIDSEEINRFNLFSCLNNK